MSKLTTHTSSFSICLTGGVFGSYMRSGEQLVFVKNYDNNRTEHFDLFLLLFHIPSQTNIYSYNVKQTCYI